MEIRSAQSDRWSFKLTFNSHLSNTIKIKKGNRNSPSLTFANKLQFTSLHGLNMFLSAFLSTTVFHVPKQQLFWFMFWSSPTGPDICGLF